MYTPSAIATAFQTAASGLGITVVIARAAALEAVAVPAGSTAMYLVPGSVKSRRISRGNFRRTYTLSVVVLSKAPEPLTSEAWINTYVETPALALVDAMENAAILSMSPSDTEIGDVDQMTVRTHLHAAQVVTFTYGGAE
jgi:hypothetical protein